MSDAAAGLLPYLHGGSLIVGRPVGRIIVLIWIKVGVRVFVIQPARLAYCSIRAFQWTGQCELDSISAQDSLSLFARISRQRELNLVAAGRAEPSICDSSISR